MKTSLLVWWTSRILIELRPAVFMIISGVMLTTTVTKFLSKKSLLAPRRDPIFIF